MKPISRPPTKQAFQRYQANEIAESCRDWQSTVAPVGEITEEEIGKRITRIRQAWMNEHGLLSPAHQASFLEAGEFRALALIEKACRLQAIKEYSNRSEILKEARSLQQAGRAKERVSATNKKPSNRRKEDRGSTKRKFRKGRTSTPSNNDPHRSDYFGHRPKGPTRLSHGPEMSLVRRTTRQLSLQMTAK